MKLGIVGKGGTGKTTLSALVCRGYANMGKRVVAVDTDSNPNLAISLGLDETVASEAPLVPRHLVVGSPGGLSPAQLVADYGLATPAGVTVLHAMRVDQAGAGCTCGSHASVRSLLGAALEEADVTLVDMEAGLEHLSRSGGTLVYADVLLVIMEPTRKSALTAGRTRRLAEELGIPRVGGVGNKARPGDAAFFEQLSVEYGIPLAAVVPFDAEVAVADRRGQMVGTPSEDVRRALAEIIAYVDSPELQQEALLRERERLERRLAELSHTG